MRYKSNPKLPTGMTYRRARSAMAGCVLIALMLPGGALATPVFAAPSSEESLEFATDAPVPEARGSAGESALPDKAQIAALDLGELSLDGGSASRRLKPELGIGVRSVATPGSPEHDDDLHLKQLFRQVINVNVETGPRATGRERLRRPATPVAGLSDLEFVNAAEAMVRDAVVNALEKGVVSLALADLGDITLTLGTERHTLYVGGSEWLSLKDTDSEKSAMRQEVRYAGSAVAYGVEPAERPVADGSDQNLSQFIAAARDFLTDPLTIIGALAWLILWEVFASIRSSRRRRPRRRARSVTRSPT